MKQRTSMRTQNVARTVSPSRMAKPFAVPRAALPLLMVFYFMLTACLVARVPMGAAPDESAHLEYVAHLATTGTLPVFAAKGANFAGYEFHQPPLYYALCAPFWKILPTMAQGYACRIVSLLCATATLWLLWHAVFLAFPRRRELALGATFFAAFWPLHQAVGASAGNDALADLICAALFWSVARVAMKYATNDGATFVRDAAIVGALAGLGVLTKNTALLIGIVSIIALFWVPKLAPSSTRFAPKIETDSPETASRSAKTEATSLHNARQSEAKRALQTSRTRETQMHAVEQGETENALPISSTRIEENPRHGIACRGVGVALGAALLVGGWWLARNQVLYGDPLAARVFDVAFRNSSPRPSSFFTPEMTVAFGQQMTRTIYLRALFLILFCTFWGIFGGPGNALKTLNPFGSRGPREEAFAFVPPMIVLLLLSVFALWGLARALPGWKNAAPSTRLILASWLVGALVMALALANFNLIQFQAQARYLHPALVPIALGFALGWRTLFSSRRALVFANVVFGVTALTLSLCNILTWRALN